MGKKKLSAVALLILLTLTCLQLFPQQATAHFSYADPRIVHVAEDAEGEMIILVRMPAPLALLPADWQGETETRLPPFGIGDVGKVLLDQSALRTDEAEFHRLLTEGFSVWVEGVFAELTVMDTKFWLDTDRPTFVTAKSAQKSFEQKAQQAELPYFDSSLDVAYHVSGASLTDPIRIASDLGQTFKVMDRFGTVVKMHRASGTETQAMLGVLHVEFDGSLGPWQRLTSVAWIGAEHIYLGFDHLAMILLIAIAAAHWRQALLWASAFTAGHVLTLAAGLYGFAPQASWFIPLVEILIVSSIVVTGASIAFKLPHVMNWPALFTIGLIHGYGFASAANAALFAGDVELATLAAFAFGMELCQFAIYLAILPLIMLLDRVNFAHVTRWRRPVAFGLAAAAGVSAVQLLIQTTGFSVA